VQMSPTWAFVRTNSAGTNKVNVTGVVSAEGNQELFVFKKDDDGAWKIARYSFSPQIRPSPSCTQVAAAVVGMAVTRPERAQILGGLVTYGAGRSDRAARRIGAIEIGRAEAAGGGFDKI
jgi:hypothetical protein